MKNMLANCPTTKDLIFMGELQFGFEKAVFGEAIGCLKDQGRARRRILTFPFSMTSC